MLTFLFSKPYFYIFEADIILPIYVFGLMEPNKANFNIWINTDDLQYTHPGGKYQFKFSYLGDCVFFLDSKGYLDEKSFKLQFTYGDTARERLKELDADLKYHLIWDVSSVSGVSFFARRHILFKLKSNSNFGSVTIIGANLFAQSFIKLTYNTLPNIKFFFFRTFDESIKNLEVTFDKVLSLRSPENVSLGSNPENYGRFLEAWHVENKELNISGTPIKYISKPNWKYQSPDKAYSVEVILIEGNIIYYICEGYAKPQDIENTYAILESIIREYRFNETENKFFSILDLKKLKGVSLSARKRTSFFESIYRDYAHFVIFLPSKVLLLMYKVVKKVSSANFKHWEVAGDLEESISKINEFQKGNFARKTFKEADSVPETLIVPRNRADIIDLLFKKHNEIEQLKKFQAEQIQKILSFTGNMTWDETFTPPSITTDDKNPFNSIFESLIILYNDFKEIIEDTSVKALQLQESEDKYRNLINLASDVIAVYQDDKLRFVNSRVTPSLGYSPEEVMEKPMYEYVAPDEISKLEEYYKKRMEEDSSIPWVYETVFIHKEGYKVPVSMSVGRIIYEGRPASMLIARDITQKKKTEEELERYRNHLEDIVRKRTEQLQKEVTDRRIAEESDRLKTAFLSNMSHEIRTPMNAIIGFSNFLRENGLTHEQRDEYLDYIESSGQSLLNLINDIIDLSKIEAKQLNIQLSDCNADRLLDELYLSFEQARKNHKRDHVQLVLNKPNSGVIFSSDPYRLKQILSNLLDNALKFTDKGSIEFGYYFEKNDIVFFVKDTGIGIPPDKKELIFKRFGRLHSSGRNLSGTGLGLAISKNLASLLNGKLWVESKEKEGSTFFLKLPCIKQADISEDNPTQQADKKSEYNWEGKWVLIAEDEDLNFRVLQIALNRTGINIVRAKNGKEAVNLIKSDQKFDIVLMDIQMPEMDGYEAMSIIKKEMPAKPIIAQTAFALLEERKKCLELGFDDYIPKPISIADLYSKMDVFLKS